MKKHRDSDRNRILVIFVLLAVVLVSSEPAVGSAEWLFYDNGNPWAGADWTFQGVRFSLPDDFSKASLQTLEFFYSGPGDVRIHITLDDHVTELTTPIAHHVPSAGFHEVDVSSSKVVVPEHFYVIIERINTGNAVSDNVTNVGRSFQGHSLAELTNLATGNLIIRAQVSFPNILPAVNSLLLNE